MPRIRVATYNVRNLFDDFTADGSSRAKPSDEIAALVKMLDRINADVVCLQEVENVRALAKVNRGLARRYPHIKVGRGNSPRGIHLAFLSRFPIHYRSHADEVLTSALGTELWDHRSEADFDAGWLYPLRFQRDLGLARIRISEQTTLSIFNLHLKSQSSYSWMVHTADQIRIAEARAAARLILEHQASNDAILVVGDLNERASEAPIAPLLSSLAYYDAVHEELGSGSSIYTYHPARFRSRIDYMLLSQPVLDRYIEGSVRIRDRWPAERASDHFAVSLDLSVP